MEGRGWRRVEGGGWRVEEGGGGRRRVEGGGWGVEGGGRSYLQPMAKDLISKRYVYR
jgi:hypothetical protein